MSRFTIRRSVFNAATPKLEYRPPMFSAKTDKSVKPTLSTLRPKRPEALALTFPTLPLCDDAEAFVAWVDATFPAILTNPSSEALDKALLALTKEYFYRRKYTQIHAHKTCLADVFHERTEQLLEKQLELARHRFLEPSAPKHTRVTLVPALYIGSEAEEDEPESP